MAINGELKLTLEGKNTIVKQRENIRIDIFGYIFINDPSKILSTLNIDNLTLIDLLNNENLSFVFKNLPYEKDITGYLKAKDKTAYDLILQNPNNNLFSANYLSNEAIVSDDGASVGTFQFDLSVKNINVKLSTDAKFDYIALISQPFNTKDNKLIYLTEHSTLFGIVDYNAGDEGIPILSNTSSLNVRSQIIMQFSPNSANFTAYSDLLSGLGGFNLVNNGLFSSRKFNNRG